jgi:hypothetical protein
MATAIAANNAIAATVNELIDEAMNTRKGVNIRLSWRRDCKVKKTCADSIEKATVAVGRIGINYDNMASVKEKRENGDLPEESQPIWHGKGEWLIFPYLIRHTVTNELYLRIYHGTSKTAIPTVQFYKNGEPIRKGEIEDVLLASEKQDKSESDCFCVKLNDMTMIGKAGVEAIEEELQTA